MRFNRKYIGAAVLRSKIWLLIFCAFMIMAVSSCKYFSLDAAPSPEPATRSQRSVYKFEPADKVRLLQCVSGSERPVFRITANIVDARGTPFPIPVFNPREQIQIFAGDVQIKNFLIGDTLQRYAILLVDVSGSMLNPLAGGWTKFEVMREACARFSDNFVDGIDHVAVMPFASSNVSIGINGADFLSERQRLLEQIRNIPAPQSNANTALFSATHAALIRLQQVKQQVMAQQNVDPQCLLVVMTDGQNDVGNPDDDPGLLDTSSPVEALADNVGIQIITVGFGNAANLDEPALKRLCWPSETKYQPANNPTALDSAFIRARSLQVERLRITFLPQQTSRGELTKPQQFKLQLRLAPENVIEGAFLWTPPVHLSPPPWEGVLTAQECSALQPGEPPTLPWIVIYFLTLTILGGTLAWLWFKLPKRLWADEEDAHKLRQRALAVVYGDNQANKR